MASDEPGGDLYAVLGVAPDAPAAEITRAYRRLVRDLHPDSRAARGVTDSGRLGEVLAAYEVLRHPSRRAAYDARRHRRRPPPPSGVAIRVRRLDREPAHPPPVFLRAGPVHVEPQPPPGFRPPDPSPPAFTTDLFDVLEALFRRW